MGRNASLAANSRNMCFDYSVHC